MERNGTVAVSDFTYTRSWVQTSGTTGFGINVASSTAYPGVKYTIKAGTQSANALSLDSRLPGH